MHVDGKKTACVLHASAAIFPEEVLKLLKTVNSRKQWLFYKSGRPIRLQVVGAYSFKFSIRPYNLSKAFPNWSQLDPEPLNWDSWKQTFSGVT